MKISFLNLPWEEDDRRGIRAGCRFPNLTVAKTNSYVPYPFLLGYAAAYSQQQGADVQCIDGVAERCPLTSVHERVGEFAPDLVVVETATTSLRHDLGAMARIREVAPHATTAMYGSHLDVRPDDALDDPAVDFVVQGEPELTSYELLRAVTGRGSVDSVAGLVSRDANGKTARTAPRPLIDDLDATLPYPLRDGMPMDRYNVPGFRSQVQFIYGSRGCPFKCTFCLWPQTNLKGKYRARPGVKIAEEIAWVLERFPQTGSFFFDDDTFNLGRTRVLDFAAEMQRRGIHVPWGMNARADNWDRDLMQRLVDTGLFTLRIGIESGDQAVLDGTLKDIDLDQARQTLEMAHELGIKNHVSFIIGLPGENPESVNNTIRFIKSVPVDSVQFSVAIPFPGTAFYEFVEQNGFLVSRDWSKYNGFDHVVVRTEEMSADEIAHAVDRARRSVYFSPKFIARRLGYIRSANDLGAIARKALRLVTPRAQ